MTTGTALERARCWLRRQRLEVEPTPLVVDRLAARRRGAWAEVAAVLVGAIALGVWMVLDGKHGPLLSNQLRAVAWILILGVGMLVRFWWQRRLERPLLAGRTTRAAHPAAPDLERVLGGDHLRAALALYGGGLLVGAVLTAFAPPGADRVLALSFLVGMAALGAINAVALATTLRRPSLAEDPESLLADDALRTEDARRTVTPYPAVIAAVLGIDATLGSPTSLALLAYAAIGAVFWYRAERAARCAPKAEPVAR